MLENYTAGSSVSLLSIGTSHFPQLHSSDMLKGVTEQNSHEAVEFGKQTGVILLSAGTCLQHYLKTTRDKQPPKRDSKTTTQVCSYSYALCWVNRNLKTLKPWSIQWQTRSETTCTQKGANNNNSIACTECCKSKPTERLAKRSDRQTTSINATI